jgi:ABC-type branched-subunit amino acid transport system substrate-binding protein
MEKIGHVERNILLLVPIIILLVALIPLGNIVLVRLTASCLPEIAGLNGVSAAQLNDGEWVGLSYGKTVFDVDKNSRNDIDDKNQAVNALEHGDTLRASQYWSKAIADDPSDAEPHIYQEDQAVSLSGSYFTMVLGLALTGDIAQGGRSALQNAYIAQSEYNQSIRDGKTKGKFLRLLVANSGSDATIKGSNTTNAGSNTSVVTSIACQIEQAAQADRTIVGVMGWDYSSGSNDAIAVLDRAHIPMLSANSSSDALQHISPYFWRIVPSDSSQASQSAIYAKATLKAKTVALFEDPHDSYSVSLAAAFGEAFNDTSSKTFVEEYTRGLTYESDNVFQATNGFSDTIQKALDQNPDMIFFSGYWTDARVLLSSLSQLTKQSKYKKFANLPIMGGDGLYTLSSYSANGQSNPSNLIFTSFASSDEWSSYVCQPHPKQTCSLPSLFPDYKRTFDPKKSRPSETYGFNLPDAEGILAYDATQTLITAYQRAYADNQSPTSIDIQHALGNIKGRCSIQGVSGQISFDTNHDPDKKAVVLVKVDPHSGKFVTQEVAGTFLKTTNSESSCS